MVKLVFCVRRRPDIETAEFHRYWREVHGPLVRTVAPALGIRRYVQVHTVPTPLNDLLAASRQAPECFDGVAELWFDSAEAISAAASTPEGAAAGELLLTDERRFIDHARSPLFLAEEHTVI
ncbi:MAG TPA: EthD domain-containing protein [Acidimicrobiales bacterium]|jgi:uncharacterized protein (TIGR02118 family)